MSNHVEFPPLMPETKECLVAAYKVAFPWHEGYKEDWTELNRKGQAAFLREVMRHALAVGTPGSYRLGLKAIADNLHSPPPTPPTLAQAREADMDTPEGKAVVRGFLATLGEGGQP
jgi:hypothetical protein